MQTLSLSYQPDYMHLFEASAMLYRKRYSRGQNAKIYVVVFGSMVLTGLLAAVVGIGLNRWNPAIPAIPVSVVILILSGFFYAKVLVPWQYRRSVAILAAESPTMPLTFTADADGMRWRDEHIDFKLGWAGVEAIYRTKGSVAFMNGAMALVVPLDAFADPERRRAFLVDALEHIPTKAAEKSRADKDLMALV